MRSNVPLGMMTNDRVFIDSNVLIHANVLTAPLHVEARQMLQQLQVAGEEVWISRQVLREYLVNVTRSQTYANPITIDGAAARAQQFEKLFRVADDNAQVTVHLLAL